MDEAGKVVLRGGVVEMEESLEAVLRRSAAEVGGSVGGSAAAAMAEAVVALTPARLAALPAAQRQGLLAEVFLGAGPRDGALGLHSALREPGLCGEARALLAGLARRWAEARLAELLRASLAGAQPSDDLLLQALATLPDVAAAALASSSARPGPSSPTAPSVWPSGWYQRTLAVALAQALEAAKTRLQAGKDADLRFCSKLLLRLCSGSGGDELLRRLLPGLHARAVKCHIWSRLSQRLLIPRDTASPNLNTFFRLLLIHAPSLRPLIGDAGLEFGPLKRLLTRGLFLEHVMEERWRVEAKVGEYLGSGGEAGQRELGRLVCVLLEVWSDGAGLRHSSLEQRRWLCRGLLGLLEWLSEEERARVEGPASEALLAGVAAHLAVSTPHLRLHGMFLGQTLAAKFCQSAQSSLDFDIDIQDPEIQAIMPEKPDRALEDDVGDLATGLDQLFQSDEAGGPKAVPVATSGDLDSDDDDFEPYELGEEAKAAGKVHDATETKKPPELFYMAQCLEALGDEKDSGRVEAGLAALDGLIRRDGVGLTELLDDVRRRLLSLQDRFSLDGFEDSVQRALVSLTVRFTQDMGVWLAQEFFKPSRSQRDRFLILRAVSGAARELAGLAEKPEEGAGRRREIRRAGTATARANGLAGRGEWLVLPLVAGYAGGRTEGLELETRDSEVLGRLVLCWAETAECCVGLAEAGRVGRAVLGQAWGLRFHPDSSVREAVVLCLSAVGRGVPSAVSPLRSALDVHLGWLLALADPVSGDPQPRVRSLAASTLAHLAQHLHQQPHTLLPPPPEISVHIPTKQIDIPRSN